MSAATHEHESHVVVDSVDEPKYRLRKPALFLPATTMSDLQKIVEQSHQRALVLRMAHVSGQRENAGQRCDSLAELAACAQLPSSEVESDKLARLRRLIKDAFTLAADLGAELEDPGLRVVCFRFCECCQRVSAEIRRQQLWEGRS